MTKYRVILSAVLYLILLILGPYLLSCGGTAPVEFAIKHLRDEVGEKITQELSYLNELGLDNTSGNTPLQVQIQFERNYRFQIIQRLQSNEISSQSVQDRLVEYYKLPPDDPEGELQTALCPISVVIPPGQKAAVTVEWTERWAEGIVNLGKEGDGEAVGSYMVFLGYYEPCSLVSQVNTNVASSYTISVTPPLVPPKPPPSDVVEIESPPELLVGQSDTIRITLRRTTLISYTPTLEIINNNLITDVIQPVATPQMPLDLAFGEKYQLFAAAKLVAPDIQIESVSPSVQPYDADVVTWLFSVSGKKPGNHKITASLTIRWLTESPSGQISSDKVNDNIERQVWRSSIPIEVTEPILRVGTYTIGEIWTFVGGGGLVGAMLGWFANDMKDKASKRSNRQGRRKK